MLFEIMNPNARGVDRLFNEEDRQKLKDIGSQLNEFLEDLTAEENDIKYGYITSSQTFMVPNNPKLADALHPAKLGDNKLLNLFADAMISQVAGGMRTKLAQNLSEEMKSFNRKLCEKQRKNIGAPGVVNNQSMNASSSNGGLMNSSASQSLLNEPDAAPDMKKKPQASENVAPEAPVHRGDTLKINNEFIVMKKRVGSLAEMKPITLTIDVISNLPPSIKPVGDFEMGPICKEDLERSRKERK